MSHINPSNFISIPQHLRDRARERPHSPAYFQWSDQGWEATSWKLYDQQVNQAARALMYLGFEVAQSVCILGFNRPEWVILDLACMTAGGAPAGIYTTCSPPEVQYIIHHSEAPIVLVENLAQWDKVHQERARLPLLKHIILMKGAYEVEVEESDLEDEKLRLMAQSDPHTLTWEDFLSLGQLIGEESLETRRLGIRGDQTATYIYTSGTTGPPKAVMLTHYNLSWTAMTARDMVAFTHTDCTLSYLPLSHIAEQIFSIHGPLCVGSPVYFARSMLHLLEDIQSARPTIFFGVPRVWEKMHAGLTARLSKLTGMKERLISTLRGVAEEVNDYKNRGATAPLSLRLRYAVAKHLFGKIKAALGLDRARVCVSGAAPIREDVLRFFASIDLRIHEVYGQSEDCGPTTFNFLDATRYGTVGQRISGIEVKIAKDGEILVKGPNVFKGYYKDEVATREAINEEGYLCSGDLGEFDKDGFLKIVGRKKEIIITAGGKNIAPKNLEAALCEASMISQAVVIGDQRKYLSVLITLNPEHLAEFATKNQLQPQGDGRLYTHTKIYQEIQHIVERVNPLFAQVEQIKRFTILPQELTIEGGELTPTMKIKRSVVQKKYDAEIEAMYHDA